MKSYGVTVQMKPLQQYFHMVLLQLIILQNDIWDLSGSLILGTLGRKRFASRFHIKLLNVTLFVVLLGSDHEGLPTSQHSGDVWKLPCWR